MGVTSTPMPRLIWGVGRAVMVTCRRCQLNGEIIGGELASGKSDTNSRTHGVDKNRQILLQPIGNNVFKHIPPPTSKTNTTPSRCLLNINSMGFVSTAKFTARSGFIDFTSAFHFNVSFQFSVYLYPSNCGREENKEKA